MPRPGATPALGDRRSSAWPRWTVPAVLRYRFPGGSPALLLLSVAAAVIALGTQPLSAQDSPIVGSIEVVGNRAVAQGTVTASAGLRVGEPFTRIDVAQAIRNLYRLGLFSQVEIEEEQLGEVSLLTVRVTELPTLSAWQAEGNRKLKRKDFEEALELGIGQRLRPQQVDEARRKLLDAYHDKGYLLAEVEPEQQLGGEGETCTLVFRVSEGQSVRIKTITFEGNTVFTDKKLKKKGRL